MTQTLDERIEELSAARRAAIPAAEINYDDDTVTIAVTFAWRRPWSLDKCEVGGLVGEVGRTLVEHFKGWEQLAGINSVLCWDQQEELLIGGGMFARRVLFPSGETELTAEDIAQRDLRLAVRILLREQTAADGVSLVRLAHYGEVVQQALLTIVPDDWAQERRVVLSIAMTDPLVEVVNNAWTVDDLNQACTTAMKIMKGRL